MNMNMNMSDNPTSPNEVESDFLTDPLSGLCPLPAHLMSTDEMRQHVMRVRQMRQSAQVFKVETEQHEKERVEKSTGTSSKSKTPKKVDISDLDML